MENLDVWQLLVTVLLAMGPWLFPEISIPYKIIFALSVISVSLLLAQWKLRKKYDALSEHHKALTEQFEEKQKEIRDKTSQFQNDLMRYQFAFQDVGYLITVTIQSKSHDRLTELHAGFERIKNGLWGFSGADEGGSQ